MYVRLCECVAKSINALYLRPKQRKLGYDKAPVGANTLNKILPDMCAAASVKRKTAHCPRVICATILFNSGIDEN